MGLSYNYPFYLWGKGTSMHDFVPRLNDGYLYHYTTASALISILNGMRLKTSSFHSLNDLREGQIDWKEYGIDGLVLQGGFSSFISTHCSLISFVSNFRRNQQVFQGTLHPRMWAQYGENNYGACVVIRKSDFLNVNKDRIYGGNKFFKLMRVVYDGTIKSMACPDEDYVGYIKKNYKDLFFHKDQDWKEECEYRLFGINLPEYLSIDGALAYICLGAHFFESRNDKKDYGSILIDVLCDKDSKCFRKLTPYSFATMNCSFGHYCETDAYWSFMELKSKIEVEYSSKNDFFNWCKNEMGCNLNY